MKRRNQEKRLPGEESNLFPSICSQPIESNSDEKWEASAKEMKKVPRVSLRVALMQRLSPKRDMSTLLPRKRPFPSSRHSIQPFGPFSQSSVV